MQATTDTGWSSPALTNPVRLGLDLLGLGLSLAAGAAILLAGHSAHHVPTALVVLPATQAMLFAVSATYHGIDWSPIAKARWQRADHAMIYVKVAGTVTALAAIVDPGPRGGLVIAGVWCVTASGVAQKIWWPNVPATWSMPVQFGQALLALPLIQAFALQLPDRAVYCLVASLTFYLVGFGVFVSERPGFWPGRFCHHDFFHVMLVCASSALYAAFAHGLAAT